MKDHNYILRLVAAALFAAIIMLTTMIYVPIGGGGYIHPGDAMIYAAAWLLGGPLAAVAAAVGSTFADIITGYVFYAPATFIIKALMGLIAGLMIKYLPQKLLFRILAMTASSLIMAFGYFAFEFFTLGKAAYANLPWNFVQAAGGIVIGTLIIEALGKIKGINNIKSKMRSIK